MNETTPFQRGVLGGLCIGLIAGVLVTLGVEVAAAVLFKFLGWMP